MEKKKGEACWLTERSAWVKTIGQLELQNETLSRRRRGGEEEERRRRMRRGEGEEGGGELSLVVTL